MNFFKNQVNWYTEKTYQINQNRWDIKVLQRECIAKTPKREPVVIMGSDLAEAFEFLNSLINPCGAIPKGLKKILSYKK